MSSNFFARDVGVVLSQSSVLKRYKFLISMAGESSLIRDIYVKAAVTLFTMLR